MVGRKIIKQFFTNNAYIITNITHALKSAQSSGSGPNPTNIKFKKNHTSDQIFILVIEEMYWPEN